MQGQAHGGDGGLDLVGPDGVISHHILISLIHRSVELRLFVSKELDDLLIVCILHSLDLWEAFRDSICYGTDSFQLFVLCKNPSKIDPQQHQAQGTADRSRI